MLSSCVSSVTKSAPKRQPSQLGKRLQGGLVSRKRGLVDEHPGDAPELAGIVLQKAADRSQRHKSGLLRRRPAGDVLDTASSIRASVRPEGSFGEKQEKSLSTSSRVLLGVTIPLLPTVLSIFPIHICICLRRYSGAHP